MMIKAIIEIGLVYPYKDSLDIMVEFSRIWGCTILLGGRFEENSIISMSPRNFKKIFGSNPQVGEYEIPKNTEHFTNSWKVKEISVK
jgi:hypothetical protein